MARPSSKDPLDKFRWILHFGDGNKFNRVGFASVDTPAYTIRTQEYPEGGDHLHPKQIVDTIEYKQITLTRGVIAMDNDSDDFLSWARMPLDIIESAKNGVTKENINRANIGTYRRSLVIEHKDRLGQTQRFYIIYNAIPIEYEPASNFSADSDDTFSFEKLTLKYESFEVTNNVQKSNPFDVKDIVKRLTRNIF